VSAVGSTYAIDAGSNTGTVINVAAGGASNHGIVAYAAGNGTGVIGTGLVGIKGTSGSGTAIQAICTNNASNGVAIYATATGGEGISASTTGAGASGVHGVSDSGVGVYGQTSSGTHGVYGYGGIGVGGDGFGEFSAGVQGSSAGASGHGVVGSATADSGNAAGVYGGADFSSAYAGYFAGKVAVTGALSKGGGSFKIDHPLDPERKFLLHSFVESPDMKNVYDGVVTTDERGLAVVGLPDWFDALNSDVRYQLTTIGSFARAMVSREVARNRFEITTDQPNVRVSWQVTGIRRDAWAEANRIPVELEKSATERGRYLHPIEHGKPPSKGIDHKTQLRIAANRVAPRRTA
jgi:hypothetical protein